MALSELDLMNDNIDDDDDDDHLVTKSICQAELITTRDPLCLAQRLENIYSHHLNHHCHHHHLPVADHGFPISSVKCAQVSNHTRGQEDIPSDVDQTTLVQHIL